MITRFRIKDHWAEQRMFMHRALAAGAVLLALTAALIGKLVQLQVVRYDYYTDLSQGNRVRIEPVPPNRGLILDRNGVVLAENLPAYQLELTVEQTPDVDAALKGLAAVHLIAAEDLPRLKRLIRSRRSFEGVPIRLQLSDEEVARFAVRRHYFPGIDIRTRLTRHYPMGELAVHALGYVAAISEQDLARIDAGEYAGTSLIGKLGIEGSYEKELHGTPGFRQVLVNAQGRPVERESNLQAGLSHKSALSGNDLILGMDVRLQRVAEEALSGKRGAVVAIDPTNGDVLALASKPGFDPHLFGRGLTVKEYATLRDDIDVPLINRAIRGTYPPGSTVKPAIALAGLAFQAINPSQQRFCNGQWRMPGVSRPWREALRGGVHGNVNLEAAIARSCDVYFYGLADKLGVDRLSGFLQSFGFGQLTGIDMSGEKAGILPSRAWKQRTFSRPENRMWFPGETVNFGIGQGYMTVTPLELANVTAIIAARGKHFKPRVTSAIRNAQTGATKHLPSQRLPDVRVPQEHWQIVVNGMMGTMTYGTARAAALRSTYAIAGKTGTAQVFSVDKGERYDEKTVKERLRDHSWFIGFAPAEAPRIALAVLVENGGYGSTAAAPIARKLMDAWVLGEYAPAAVPTPPVQATGDE